MKRKNIGTLCRIGMSCPIMKKHRHHCAELDICGISEKYSRCNKRENIGTLSRVGHEVSDNEQMLQPSCGVRHPESDQMSTVYWRNI